MVNRIAGAWWLMSVVAEEDLAVRVPRDRVRRLPRLMPGSAAPRVVGRACALVGLLDLAAAVFPGFRHSRMHVLAGVFPGTVTSVAAAAGWSPAS